MRFNTRCATLYGHAGDKMIRYDHYKAPYVTFFHSGGNVIWEKLNLRNLFALIFFTIGAPWLAIFLIRYFSGIDIFNIVKRFEQVVDMKNCYIKTYYYNSLFAF